jgi:hypothetical protein
MNTQIDFSKYQFRCSGLGYLMTEARSKTETLSESTKTYLRDIFIKEVYGRTQEKTSKYLEKGIYVEEDSLTLMGNHFEGELMLKNKATFENSFIKGTPDFLSKKKVRDAKSSWSIWTFAAADGSNKNYFWQLQGYMWLTKRKEAELVYCLVDTPDHMIDDEKRKIGWKGGMLELPEDVEAEIENNCRYSDIPESERVKVFKFEFDQEAINSLKSRIREARKYLATLSLTNC